jgi:hypothetical protein
MAAAQFARRLAFDLSGQGQIEVTITFTDVHGLRWSRMGTDQPKREYDTKSGVWQLLLQFERMGRDAAAGRLRLPPVAVSSSDELVGVSPADQDDDG